MIYCSSAMMTDCAASPLVRVPRLRILSSSLLYCIGTCSLFHPCGLTVHSTPHFYHDSLYQRYISRPERCHHPCRPEGNHRPYRRSFPYYRSCLPLARSPGLCCPLAVMLPSLFVALHLQRALCIWRAPYLWRAVCRYGRYVPYIRTVQSFAFPDPEPRYQIPFRQPLRLKLIAIALCFVASISSVARI